MTSNLVRFLIVATFAIPALTGCGNSDTSTSNGASREAYLLADSERSVKAYAETINQAQGPPRVDTGLKDAHGNAITASCSTCHASRTPNFENKVSSDLDEFHAGIPFAHGTTTCLSCHNGDDYDTLKLSNGQRLKYPEVMTLCGQCHGAQMRDYENGAHGGMNGYWDLNRGPRTRNNCVDCHDPHVPKFPSMNPTFKPIDRFLNDSAHSSDDAHE